MTRSELRALIRRSEMTAVLLTQPGAFLPSSRAFAVLADDLATLAGVARRAFQAETMRVPLYDVACEPDACAADLLGGAE